MIRRRRPGDDGVIAIIVALSISTFLLGFAALAVDLGSAYVRKAELQSIADRLAIAGATGLPDIGQAQARMLATLAQICQDSRTPGICPADGSAPSLAWATDQDPANGEVTFLTNSDGDGRYQLSEHVTNLSQPSTALEVSLPPSTVQFGLASALGFSSVDIHKSAAARIGTPVGRGILPFALTPLDLAPTANGQFCVSASGAPPATVPAQVGPINWGWVTHFNGGAPNNDDQLTMVFTLQDPAVGEATSVSNVIVHYINDGDPSNPLTIPATLQAATLDRWVFSVPAGDVGTTAKVWATGTYKGQQFISSSDGIIYTGDHNLDNLCDQPSAFRGYISLARTPAVGDTLPQNIRSGPDVKLYQAGGALGQLGSALHCASADFSPATTCLTTIITSSAQFSLDVTDGLLNANDGIPGRLIGNCGTNTALVSHGVDGSNLFDAGSGLLAVGTDGRALQADIVAALGPPAGGPPPITSQVLRCPRLAVMPVIDTALLTDVNGNPIGNKITEFRYVWIDDTTSTNRGVNGVGSQVTSFRGYIIPGGYLPDLVAGSPEVGPYLGADMPREAVLIHDLNTPMP